MSTFELFDAEESIAKRESTAGSTTIMDSFEEDTSLNGKFLQPEQAIKPLKSTVLDEEINYRGKIIRLYPQDPRTPTIRNQILVLLFMFTTLGLNDQATGMLIPLLSSYYSISKVHIANIFLLQTFGYFCSCFVSEPLHLRYGIRGALMFSCLCIALPSFILSTKVSWFSLYLACYFPIGMGIGLLDSIVNCIFSSFICYKNELLGAVHGMYGVFSFFTPLIINRLGDENWNDFFILQFAISGIGTVLCWFAFRFETKEKYEYLIKIDTHGDSETEDGNQVKISTMELLKRYPLVTLYAIALFFYLGAEVGTGSWLYTYLIEYKDGGKTLMSYITSSYWLGLTAGRFYFGMMIEKWFVNEYQAAKFFVKTTMLCSLLLVVFGAFFSGWKIYFFTFGAIVFSCGLFIGPIFPLLSIIGADMLDSNVKVKGLSIAISVGSIGGAFLPYVDGLLIKQWGLASFPTLIFLSSAVCLVAVCAYPYFIANKHAYFYPHQDFSILGY